MFITCIFLLQKIVPDAGCIFPKVTIILFPFQEMEIPRSSHSRL